MIDLASVELGKKAAAAMALSFVDSGMVVGLGSGSTATFFIRLLSEKINNSRLRVSCVPTSSVTKRLAESLKIPLTTLDKVHSVDLTVDGTDEFDPNLNLIKGGGGALLQEKIVAKASRHIVVITDSSKESFYLGGYDLPVEVVRFGANSTKNVIYEILRNLGYTNFTVQYRRTNDQEKFVTDEGHFIFDLSLKSIIDVEELNNSLIACTGVVETGLFLGMADTIIVGNSDGSCKLIGASKI